MSVKWLVRAFIWLPAIAVAVLAGVFPSFGKAIQYPLEALAALTLIVLVATFLIDSRAVRTRRERKLREEISQEVLAQKQGCPDHPYPHPDPSCWVCARDGAFQRSALIASGKFGMIFPPAEGSHGLR
jgi:hypothetical protein